MKEVKEPNQEGGGSAQTDTTTKISVELGSFQIDNMVNDEMPVILGAARYYEKSVELAREDRIHKSIAEFYRSILDKDLHNLSKYDKAKPKQRKRAETKREKIEQQAAIPFLKFKLKKNVQTHANKIGSIIRFEYIQFGMQEFFIQVETSILNDNLKLVFSIINNFSVQDEDEKVCRDADEWEKALLVPRGGRCPLLDASQGVVFDASQI